MNLTTLAERACLESGYNDTDDVVAAKKFARHWDEHVYNSALWKDALIACDIAVDPETYEDHAEGIVFLPEVFDRVLGVRSTSNQILIQGQETYYRMDYDAFEASGNPVEFHHLPPAWFIWRWSEQVNYLTVSGVVGDASAAIKIIWMDGAGKRTTTVTTVGALAKIEPASEDYATILAVYKPATTAAVDFATPPAVNLVSGNYITFGAYTFRSVTVEVGVTYDYTPGNEWYLAYTLNGTPIPAGEFTATSAAVSLVAFNDTYAGTPATASIVGAGYGVTAGTLAATDTASPKYARIRLVPKPTTAVTITVLGKAKYEPLEFDQQEPALRNATNCLLAYIRASLRRRGGENAAAQLEFAEANALLKELTSLEAVQAAHNSRFVPQSGYGPDLGLGPYGFGGL